jgi:hypothetical protein
VINTAALLIKGVRLYAIRVVACRTDCANPIGAIHQQLDQPENASTLNEDLSSMLEPSSWKTAQSSVGL